MVYCVLTTSLSIVCPHSAPCLDSLLRYRMTWYHGSHALKGCCRDRVRLAATGRFAYSIKACCRLLPPSPLSFESWAGAEVDPHQRQQEVKENRLGFCCCCCRRICPGAYPWLSSVGGRAPVTARREGHGRCRCHVATKRDGMRGQNMMPEATVVRENTDRYQRRQRSIHTRDAAKERRKNKAMQMKPNPYRYGRRQWCERCVVFASRCAPYLSFSALNFSKTPQHYNSESFGITLNEWQSCYNTYGNV